MTTRKSTARPRRRQTPRSPSASTRGRRSRDVRSASPRRSHTGSSGSPESHTQGAPSSRLTTLSEPQDGPRAQNHSHPPREPRTDHNEDDDDDEDDDDGDDHLRINDDDDDDDGSDKKHQYIRLKGRILGRYRCMWTSFSTVFEEGLSRLPQEDPDTLPRRRQRLYSIYVDFISIAPLLGDYLRIGGQHGFSTIIRALERSRKKSRATDIISIKTHIGGWRNFSPPFNGLIRHELGFHNDSTGFLLCPAYLDWKDPGVHDGLRSGMTKVTATDYPKFLWEGDEINPADFFEGFMKGEMVLKGAKHIYICPNAAMNKVTSHRATRNGNAVIHGIRNMSVQALAYVATLVRFALSDQSSFDAGGTPGRWPYRAFYNALIKTMTNDMDESSLNELLDWWDTQLFSDMVDDDEIGNEGDGDDEELENTGSMAARMRAQAAMKRRASTASQ